VREWFPRDPLAPRLNAKAALAATEATLAQLVDSLGCIRRKLGDWAWLQYPIVVSKARREIALEYAAA
jgi:hypothetical protein